MSNGISQNIPVSRNDIGHFDCVATVIRAENFVSRFPLWFRNIPNITIVRKNTTILLRPIRIALFLTSTCKDHEKPRPDFVLIRFHFILTRFLRQILIEF